MRITENRRYLDMVDKLHEAFPYWERMEGKTLFLSGASGMIGSLLRAAVLVGALYLAWYLHTDYDCGGILLILVFYYFRAWRQRGCFIGLFWMMCVSGTWYYLPGYMASFGLIWLYNGQRGRQPWPWKMAYYLFYPLHLLALYGIYAVLMV